MTVVEKNGGGPQHRGVIGDRQPTAHWKLVAQIAYLNTTPLEGQEVNYETLKRIAQETIQANCELQVAKFGAVRLKLSIPKLLRRGR